MEEGAKSSSSCYEVQVSPKDRTGVQITHSWSRHGGTVVMVDGGRDIQRLGGAFAKGCPLDYRSISHTCYTVIADISHSCVSLHCISGSFNFKLLAWSGLVHRR